MPSHHVLCSASALLLAATSLTAQFTIADGNMRYTTDPLSPIQESPLAFQLRNDARAVNHGYEQWWHYRIAGDPREYSFKNVGGTQEGVRPNNTHLDRDFADVDSRGLLKARIDYDVYRVGPASGVVINRLTLQNVSPNPVTLDTFVYTDIDLANTPANDVCTGNMSSHRITDFSGLVIELRAIGNDRSDIGAFPAVRDLLTNGVVDDLANNLPPFNGDYTGAFQWSNRTLQPGEWRTFELVIAVDTQALIPPSTESYGAGSNLGAEIYTDTIALQNNAATRWVEVRLRGARPNAPVGLLTNSFAAPGVPFLGVVVWVDPNPPSQFPIGFTDGNGEVFVSFEIPPSPYLAGFPVFHQYFWEDSTAPSGIAGFTGGLKTFLGKL